MKIPHAHFGTVGQKLDWQKEPTNLVDDDELEKPPHSIVALLKLNPLKLFESHRRDEQFKEHLRHTPEDGK
jgi:hypothetical protein